jgi:general secretion pathway protein A
MLKVVSLLEGRSHKTNCAMKNPFETKEYLSYYGLREAPYSTNPDERLLYLTDQHQDAIAMVGHVVENKEGAGLIVGEQGTGKTTIMRRIVSLMNDAEGFRVAVVETAEHSPTLFQLVKEILESFGIACVGRDTQTRVDQLKQMSQSHLS